MLIIPGIIASSYPVSTTSFHSIATISGTGSASSFTFNSIPSTFKHLQIRTFASVGDMDDIVMQFNSDTGSTYSWHMIVGNGSSAAAYSGTSTTYMKSMTWMLQTANVYGAGIIDILDYADTNKYKTVKVLTGCDNNTATTDGQMYLCSGNWRNTNAITSITLKSLANKNFTTATRFALYGVKG